MMIVHLCSKDLIALELLIVEFLKVSHERLKRSSRVDPYLEINEVFKIANTLTLHVMCVRVSAVFFFIVRSADRLKER